MNIKYVHTNVIAKDCLKLAEFYVHVFRCERVGKEYELYGDWLKEGANIKSTKLKGINLSLPGWDKDGPILEIFQYDEMFEKAQPIVANREGFGHIAFHVDDVEAVLEQVLANGGNKLGSIVKKEFKTGTLTFTYATDPEGNIIELQNYQKFEK